MSSSVFAGIYLVAQLNVIYGKDFAAWDRHQLFLSGLIIFLDHLHYMGRLVSAVPTRRGSGRTRSVLLTFCWSMPSFRCSL